MLTRILAASSLALSSVSEFWVVMIMTQDDIRYSKHANCALNHFRVWVTLALTAAAEAANNRLSCSF